MLTLLAGDGLCPCCAFGFLAPARRRAPRAARRVSNFTCTDAPAPSAQTWFRAGNRPDRIGTLCLQGGTVVDPRDGSMVENATVVIEGGRIVSIGAAAGLGATRIDASGKYIVPGYNDMHSHVMEHDDPSGSLALMLAEGITGFRQMSGSSDRLLERRNGTLPIGAEAPDALEMPGAVLTPLNAASGDAAIAEIRRQKELGADFIKVTFASAPVFVEAIREAGRAGIPILGHLQDGVDPALAVEEGFRSIEHLGPGTTIWIACSTIEDELRNSAVPARVRTPPVHLPFVRRLIAWRLQTMLINPAAFAPPAYAPTLQRAIDTFDEDKFKALAACFIAQGTWHVPTLVRLRTQQLADAPEYQNHPSLQYFPEKGIRTWRGVVNRFRKLPDSTRKTFADAYPRQLQLTKLLADSGVRMMTGTDGSWLPIPGMTLREEFIELGKAGLSPAKILEMATINAAIYLRRTDTMGTVEPGRNADLVLLDANPLEAVENLYAIAGVIRAGTYHSRQDLDALRRRVAANRGDLNQGVPPGRGPAGPGAAFRRKVRTR